MSKREGPDKTTENRIERVEEKGRGVSEFRKKSRSKENPHLRIKPEVFERDDHEGGKRELHSHFATAVFANSREPFNFQKQFRQIPISRVCARQISERATERTSVKKSRC